MLGRGTVLRQLRRTTAPLREAYKNFRLHKGWFENSVNDSTLSPLRTDLPILVWIDVDYYSSARTVFEKLIPYLPNGCVIYFDEYDNLNYGSRLTGEARLVHEINHGALGEEIELVSIGSCL